MPGLLLFSRIVYNVNPVVKGELMMQDDLWKVIYEWKGTLGVDNTGEFISQTSAEILYQRLKEVLGSKGCQSSKGCSHGGTERIIVSSTRPPGEGSYGH